MYIFVYNRIILVYLLPYMTSLMSYLGSIFHRKIYAYLSPTHNMLAYNRDISVYLLPYNDIVTRIMPYSHTKYFSTSCFNVTKYLDVSLQLSAFK